MRLTTYTFSVTTDGSGDASVDSPHPVSGKVDQVRYEPADSDELDTNADVVIKGATSNNIIYDADDIGTSAFVVRPRAACVNAADGSAWTDDVTARPVVYNELINVTVAQGGATKSGTFYVTVEE